MTGVEYDRELKQNFNNSTYFVRALHKNNTLYVEVEQENTGYKWNNQFINSYIEEMTSKTGNFKTFDKFCRMIYSALQPNNNGSVFIDLLTYQDLEILKARKAAKSGIQPQSQLNATHRTKNKRYLILTYVVEFDRVHYPLALKLDENSIDDNTRSNNNRCATNTARRLLSHSSSSSSSSSSSTSSSTSSSPNSLIHTQSQRHRTNRKKSDNLKQHQPTKPKQHYRSTPNLNNDADDGNIDGNINDNEQENTNTLNQPRQSMTSYQSPKTLPPANHHKLKDIMAENMKLKLLLKQQQQQQQANNSNHDEYPSDKLTDIIEVLEDEMKVLKQELEKKNLEIRRMSRSNKQYQQKHISKRLDDLEDEIERLSTELLQERTKCRRINREFNIERQEFNKKIEALQASNDHYKRKCRQLKEDLNATKQTLENVRLKASKQRLYNSSTKSLNHSSTSLRGSRSRSRNNNNNNNNNKYQLKPRNNRRNNHQYKSHLNRSANSNLSTYRQRSRSNNSKNSKYQRSSSAPRFSSNKRSLYSSRSRSPSVRFDPTAWAKQKREKIERAKMMRNTFGKSRSPSPFRRTSRSVSPKNNRMRSKGNGRKNRMNQNRNRKRERSNSRKRNSFGTTISRSPKSRRSSDVNKKRLPLPMRSKRMREEKEKEEEEDVESDLNVLSSMEQRKQRILSMKGKMFRDEEDENVEDGDDDDDESIFNPTKEIESIDSRLNALQKFLRAAKSSS